MCQFTFIPFLGNVAPYFFTREHILGRSAQFLLRRDGFSSVYQGNESRTKKSDQQTKSKVVLRAASRRDLPPLTERLGLGGRAAFDGCKVIASTIKSQECLTGLPSDKKQSSISLMRTSRDQRSKIVGRLARLAHCVPTSRCLDKIDGGSIFSADRDRARGLESYLMIRFQAQLEPAYLLLYLVGTVPHGKES